jgi:hypothetical protein
LLFRAFWNKWPAPLERVRPLLDAAVVPVIHETSPLSPNAASARRRLAAVGAGAAADNYLLDRAIKVLREVQEEIAAEEAAAFAAETAARAEALREVLRGLPVQEAQPQQSDALAPPPVAEAAAESVPAAQPAGPPAGSDVGQPNGANSTAPPGDSLKGQPSPLEPPPEEAKPAAPPPALAPGLPGLPNPGEPPSRPPEPSGGQGKPWVPNPFVGPASCWFGRTVN